MKQFKDIINKFLRPSWIIITALIALTTLLLLYIFAAAKQDTIIAYTGYLISAYTLTVFALKTPAIVSKIKTRINANHFGNLYLNDIAFRAKISLYQGLFINLIYAVFKLLTSFIYQSVWFAAIAIYYIILSMIRFALIHSYKKVSSQSPNDNRLYNELYSYRLCGIFMFILNIAMAGMITQMIWQNKVYVYPGYIIYATAAYSFYSLIMAIVNMVRFRKMNSPILSASKLTSFAGALMSILALQTAMIYQFGNNDINFMQVMNTATGIGVSVTVFVIAIFMVISANKRLKKLRLDM